MKDISLEVKTKEIVCITGESGAGKSTLLHIAGTLLSPSSGELKIAGEDATKLQGNRLSAFRNKHLGFVFQFHQLIAELSAVENTMLPMLIAGITRSKAEKEAKDRLVYLGLEHRVGHKPGQLSGGEQQRVSIARALAMKPSVILADEPSGNLDSKNAKHIHELFLKMRDDFDLTFLIVTHNLELAQLADRRVELADGRINDLNT
ncbi:MAG: ABC transporter ATP-binding protein [Bacteroidota bacterium]|nr:ABC transporter ATP-binding protein [Bacteroidota bacterium]